MCFIYLIHILTVFSYELTLKNLKTNCMTDFVAVNMDSSEITISIISECYKQIPNYKHDIVAFNLKAICYVSPSKFFIHKDSLNVTRCGEWLSVTGPSQKSVHCMVVGSATMFYQNQNLEQNGENIIGLKAKLFMLGSSQLTYVKDSVYQATVAICDYLIQVSPSVLVLNVTAKDVMVQVYDVNRPVEFIEMSQTMYPKRDDDTFIIDRPLNPTDFKLVSLDSEKVGMPTVYEQVGYKATGTTSFPHYIMSDCKFIASTLLYSKESEKVNPLLTWYQFKVNSVFKAEMLNLSNPMITTNKGDGDVMLSFIYGSAFFMSQEYTQLRCEFITDFQFEIVDVKLLLIKNIEKASGTDGILVIRDNLKYQYKQVNNTVSLSIAMDKTCKEFSNGISIRYKSAPGDVLKIKKASFDPIQEMLKLHQCDQSSFDCSNTECTVDEKSLDVGMNRWKDGCAPICGRCRDGFVCTTMGKCVVEANNNLRSHSICTQVVLFLLVVFLL
ncbi:hypothetical protein EIN_418150 [Entamoeba invadens IP1]|uniref:Uncharacterized protein n=1 Tax=Entamoeba invadens IP1 TaxID=370355 RepID=A0A0A1U1S3_ENTIV|nr:hypothetical protein EIN_418150 [Entamoeba invadens IP1]ELP87966.1 hypothetical protein EIN_418150 [Entamoeba invadens IP1]|eukprot:XP_004254737.1 hypothetical protein EIN_418150 [Entamoeba invadens IP1]